MGTYPVLYTREGSSDIEAIPEQRDEAETEDDEDEDEDEHEHEEDEDSEEAEDD